jgi:hypothetical protein
MLSELVAVRALYHRIAFIMIDICIRTQFAGTNSTTPKKYVIIDYLAEQ